MIAITEAIIERLKLILIREKDPEVRVSLRKELNDHVDYLKYLNNLPEFEARMLNEQEISE